MSETLFGGSTIIDHDEHEPRYGERPAQRNGHSGGRGAPTNARTQQATPRGDSVAPARTVPPVRVVYDKRREVVVSRIRPVAIVIARCLCAILNLCATIYAVLLAQLFFFGTSDRIGIAAGIVIALLLFVGQVATSDWTSWGTFFWYCVIFVPDVIATIVTINNVFIAKIILAMTDNNSVVRIALSALVVMISIIISYYGEQVFTGRRQHNLRNLVYKTYPSLEAYSWTSIRVAVMILFSFAVIVTLLIARGV